MNKVILTGRFTKDPESRMGSNQLEVARFSLACQNDFMTKDGNRDTEFVNCVAFGKTASTITKFCKKGQMISATGRIKNNSYTAQDGTKRYTTDIVVEHQEFAESKKSSEDSAPTHTEASQTQMEEFMNVEDIVEDLPFR